MEQKTRAVLTIGGSGLALIGAFLPWFSEKFSPPDGYAIVNGQRFTTFNHIYNVMGLDSTQPYSIVRTTVITMLFIGLFNILALIISENSAGKAMHFIATVFHAHFTQGLVGFIQALALIVEALGWLALSFLAINYGTITFDGSTSPSAVAAGHYASMSLGVGFYFLVAGTILAGIAVYKSIGILGPIILIVIGFLFCTDSPYLAQFLQLLVNLKIP